jgi:uncharacterized membrane protein
LFEYKAGHNFFYKLPPIIRLGGMFVFSIVLMSMAFWQTIAAIIFLSLFSLICGISLREQASDIWPIRYYFLLLYISSIISQLMPGFSAGAFMPNKPVILFALRLISMLQLSGLIFRTLTVSQIQTALVSVETFIRRLLAKTPCLRHFISKQNKITFLLSVFINSIPQEIRLFNNIDRAFKARGGKTFAKFRVLPFVFILESLYLAAQKAKALKARGLIV